MSKIENVERTIRRVEGFVVHFRYRDGADVRGDKSGLPPYPFNRGAANDLTVEAWKQIRFRRRYPGYEVTVVNSHNAPVRGNTRLATLRESYDQ
jgi:hypothetical protein